MFCYSYTGIRIDGIVPKRMCPWLVLGFGLVCNPLGKNIVGSCFPDVNNNERVAEGANLTCAVHLGGKAFIHFFVEFARAIITTKSFVNEVKKERVEMV